MTDSDLFAWILRSIPANGGMLWDVIGRADAVMRVVPSHAELEKGLGWLIDRQLVEIQQGRYLLTADGRDLLDRVEKRAKTMAAVRESLPVELRKLVGAEAPLHHIEPLELSKAYKRYQKEFWKAYRKLQEKSAEEARRATWTIGRSDFKSYYYQLPLNEISSSVRTSRRSPAKDQGMLRKLWSWDARYIERRAKRIRGSGFWDFAYEHPRFVGLMISLLGLIMYLSKPITTLRFQRFHFTGALLGFWGLWSVLTNRFPYPGEESPRWWTMGCVILILLAMVLTW
jgi:hypothetical protein